MTRYVLSAKARLDAQQIWNHIAEDNIDAADKVKQEFRIAMRQLAAMPGMGDRRNDVKDQRLRFWSVYKYVIAYLPATDPLQIARVVHGAQNFKKLFRSSGI